MPEPPDGRRVVLVTGVSRLSGIGAAVAERLAADGWDVAITYYTGYDERMPWGSTPSDVDTIVERCRAHAARTGAIEADLTDAGTPAGVFDEVERDLGAVEALVMCHCESVDSDIRTTTVESFDRHYAVNVRATWLLIREFAERYRPDVARRGRIIAFTSDHTVDNVPYGATKGALDRLVLAAAAELRDLAVTANVVNPGPNDTGWMTDDLKEWLVARTPLGRLGRPTDAADLISFLCSPEGGWINGQLLTSDGGISASK
ncbi:MAG TPA: SDR family oxidoreductase [Ilumatobacteraceae bacterium]|nr:SDR family oxidoreductase [Ilumatobacteraceae bacterium]